MAVNLEPFSPPNLARFPDNDQQNPVIKELSTDCGKDTLVSLGQRIIQAGDPSLPGHFHEISLYMGHATVERSFKRGAGLAIGILSLEGTITVDDWTVAEHVVDLNTYRNEGESFSSAAIRLGGAATYADKNMARYTFQIGTLFDESDYDAHIIQRGAAYLQLIVERALVKKREAELDKLSSAEALDAQFGPDFS